MIIGGVRVKLAGGGLCWQAGLAIDADGAPRAYHPVSKQGLDALANAGRPGNWWGIVCDAKGEPIVQGPKDPAPGFYVSPTALVDASKKASDPRRYVDASTVPYLAVPPEALAWCKKADVAMVMNRANGELAGAVIADVGPRGKIGEGSPALAVALGISADPRRGGTSKGIAVVIFCGSSKGWPRTVAEVDAQARELFAAWGGVDRLVVEVG